MDASTLRALQAPLKQRYREDPASAVVSLHAEGGFPDPGITCTVRTWAGPVRAGLHPATGGDGADACSGDLLLQALLACAGVTLRSVATALDLRLGAVSLTVTGSFDVRGTLGLSRDVPVGVRDVTVTAVVDADPSVVPDADLDRLATLAERYCVVAASLSAPPRFVVVRRGPSG